MVKKVNAIQIINTSDSVKKADYYTKIEEIENKIPGHEKYITTNDFNKFLGTIFDERLKQAKLATGNDLNTVVKRAIKNEEKIEKLQTFHLSYFLGKHFFGDDGFQNMFAHKPTFSTLFFFFKKAVILLLLGNRKVYLNLKFFLTKRFGYEIGIQFNNTPLI